MLMVFGGQDETDESVKVVGGLVLLMLLLLSLLGVVQVGALLYALYEAVLLRWLVVMSLHGIGRRHDLEATSAHVDVLVVGRVLVGCYLAYVGVVVVISVVKVVVAVVVVIIVGGVVHKTGVALHVESLRCLCCVPHCGYLLLLFLLGDFQNAYSALLRIKCYLKSNHGMCLS